MSLGVRRGARSNGLDTPARRIRNRVVETLASVWIGDDLVVRVAAALAELLPESRVMVATFDGDTRPDEIAHDLDGRLSRRGAAPARPASLTSHLAAAAERPHGDNQALATQALFDGAGDQLHQLRATLLKPLELHFAMWSYIMSDDGQLVALCGFFRHRRHGDYGSREKELFDGVIPALADGFSTLRLIENADLSAAALRTVLSAHPGPALVLSATGELEYANELAWRPGAPLRPIGLPGTLRGGGSDSENDSTDLRMDGRPVTLLLRPWIPDLPLATPAIDERLGTLPPTLRRVADLLLDGLCDKEICVTMDNSLATTRTYVGRVFRRLGVSGRAELMSSALAETSTRLAS